MRTLIIDDVGVSVTVKFYYNLVGTRVITECTGNRTGQRISLAKWQGKDTPMGAYVKEVLAQHITWVEKTTRC